MPITLTLDCFDPVAIMESGQCFRMCSAGINTVEAIANGKCVHITTLDGGRFRFDCTRAVFESTWRTYFDVDTDYAHIIAAAPADDIFLQRALVYARGLRLLQQDPWETLCGFILSQRKHIKAIRACMEALCEAFGDPVPGTTRKSFPTAATLAALSDAQARICGLGYRTPYLLDAARKVASRQLDLAAIAALPDDTLQQALLTVSGVGVKVADCVMLFAYRRLSRAPVDVWIRRVIDELYNGISPFQAYGEYAGVYQQYMFMLRRDEKQMSPATPPDCACDPKALSRKQHNG